MHDFHLARRLEQPLALSYAGIVLDDDDPSGPLPSGGGARPGLLRRERGHPRIRRGACTAARRGAAQQ